MVSCMCRYILIHDIYIIHENFCRPQMSDAYSMFSIFLYVIHYAYINKNACKNQIEICHYLMI